MTEAEVPLIFTKIGNVPIADLEYSCQWDDTPDFIKVTDVYRFNGKIVREDEHVFDKTRGVNKFDEVPAGEVPLVYTAIGRSGKRR